MNARALDHLVLPTADLGVARGRLAALGFTVAPDGVHPFGTNNACVYLADGTFLEALAIADPSAADAAAASGNSFVAGDRRFRAAHGDEGFSAVAFATDDARADRDQFAGLGMEGGPMVAFSRPTQDSSGRADVASFLLAFAAHASAPDLFFFTCERQNAPNIDRSELQTHANGVSRIAAIGATAGDADAFAGFFAAAARSTSRPAERGIDVKLANARLHVTPADDAATLLTVIVFGVADVAATRRLFDARDIGYDTIADGALQVAATAGQGAAFVFQEMP